MFLPKEKEVQKLMFIITSLAIGLFVASTVSEKNSEVSRVKTQSIDDALEHLEEIKIPLLLQEMGFDAHECEVLDQVTPDTSVIFDDDSWSITFSGTVICHGVSTAMYLPSRVGVYDTGDGVETSWYAISFHIRE